MKTPIHYNQGMMQPRGFGYFRGEVLNVPNLISFLRLALVPVFLYLLLEEDFLWAIVVLAVAGITDYLDGFFARKLNQVTKLGKFLDPLADRLYIFTTLIALAATGHVPTWLAVLVVLRDLLIFLSLPVLAGLGYSSLPVHYLGKAATFALLYSFPLLLMGKIFTEAAEIIMPLAWAFALWGVALYWWSGFVYLWQLVLLVRKARGNSTNVEGRGVIK